jgi:hypothetical protein
MIRKITDPPSKSILSQFIPIETKAIYVGSEVLAPMTVKGTKKKEGKAIRVTGHEGPWGCETSRFPHFLHNRLTHGGEVVSLTRQPPFTPQEDSWYSFLLEAESTPGP